MSDSKRKRKKTTNKKKRKKSHDDIDSKRHKKTKTSTTTKDLSQSRNNLRTRENKILSDLDPHMAKCYNLLVDIMKLSHAEEFNQPVDWEAMGLYEYPNVVTTPLDLGTVKNLLLNKAFQNIEHFADHVRLVFNNALKFNKQGSAIYNAAKALLELFERRFEELDIEAFTGKPAPNTNFLSLPIHNEDPEIKELKEKLKFNQDEIKRVKKRNTVLKKQINRPKVKRVLLTQPSQPLTYEEKEELCNLIPMLDPNDIHGLLKIIPNDGNGRELEIDFEKLDDYTLIKIKEYVSKCTVVQTEPEDSKKGGSDKDTKLAKAENRTANRLNEIEKQIKAVEKSKDIHKQSIIVVNPSEQDQIGFWLAKVAEISNIKEGKVKVQWFEFRKEDEKNSDIKYFELVNNFDTISVNAIVTDLNVRLEYSQDKGLYILNDYKRVKEDFLKSDSLIDV